MSLSRKRLIVTGLVSGIALAGLALALFWTGPEKGGVDQAASVLPADVATLVWSAPLGEILEFASDAGLSGDLLASIDSKYGSFRERLGIDPLSAVDLASQGFDLGQPLALALVPGERSRGLAILYVPLLSDTDTTALIKKLATRVAPKQSALVDGKLRGNFVLWFHPVAGGEVAGAIVGLDRGFAMVLPVDPDETAGATVADEVKRTVARLLDPAVDRLADRPGYSRAVAGSGGSIWGLYVNPAVAGKLLRQELPRTVFAVAFEDLEGIATYVNAKRDRITVASRRVGPDGKDATTFSSRDLTVFDIIPGRARVGLHLALSPEQVVSGIEKIIASNKWVWEAYAKRKGEAIEALELPAKTEVYDLWDGEIGIFVSELTPSPELIIHSTVLFVGLADLGKVKTAVRATARLFGEKHFTEEKLGETTVWRITAQGMTMGLMVHKGRLWFAGDFAALAAIEQGKQSSERTGERTKLMTQDMREANGGACYVDLAALVGHLPAVLSRETQNQIAPFAPLLSGLDYLSWQGEVEGNVATAKLTVTFNSKNLRQTLSGIAAAQLKGTKDGRSSGATGEDRQ